MKIINNNYYYYMAKHDEKMCVLP